MKVGSIVKFANPEADEQDERFTVIEDRGERVLVVSHGFDGSRIKPQAVYKRDDLVECES